MTAVHSGQEAKEFLISKIVTEACNDNVPISELERKMLYFTETGWTHPDIMKVNEDFDREYDHDEYEYKIAKLVTKAYERICKGSREEYDRWWSSVRLLQREIHYILVMIQMAGLRPRRDQLRLFATALGIATCLLAWGFVSAKYDIRLPSREFLWAAFAALLAAYWVLRFILGSKRTGELTSKVLERLVRIYQRVSGTV
jgi:hypothetical protein